jgi:hypothetical protein
VVMFGLCALVGWFFVGPYICVVLGYGVFGLSCCFDRRRDVLIVMY